MANFIEKITKYTTEALDTFLVTDSKTALLEDGKKWQNLNFKETGYVKIASILMDGLSDYYRVNEGTTGVDYSHYQGGEADGYKVGNASLTWEIFKLRYDRGRQFQIDELTDEESAGLMIGNLLSEFMRTKVVPEVDAVRFSTIVDYCSETLGNKVVDDGLTAENLLSKWNAAFEWLAENEIPAEDQIIFVSEPVMTMLRNAPNLVKYLTQDEIKRGDISFGITKFEGRPIVAVPSSRFYSDVDVNANGFGPKATSRLINFAIVSKKAVVPVVKLEKSKVWTPDSVQDFDGYKINFRMFHDTLVPKNKIIASYVSMSDTPATTKANILRVALAEGSVTNAYVVKAIYTNPAAIKGTLVFKSTPMNVGSIEAGATVVAYDTNVLGGVNVVDAANDTGYFALLGAGNVVLAASTEITLPKKA